MENNWLQLSFLKKSFQVNKFWNFLAISSVTEDKISQIPKLTEMKILLNKAQVNNFIVGRKNAAKLPRNKVACSSQWLLKCLISVEEKT